MTLQKPSESQGSQEVGECVKMTVFVRIVVFIKDLYFKLTLMQLIFAK
jgi:hypothetical protein